jgi:hypothetical protein
MINHTHAYDKPCTIACSGYQAPTWHDQLALVQNNPDAKNFEDAVRIMNTLVQPCPIQARVVWLFGWRPRQHKYIDLTYTLNTATYLTLERCEDCGWCKLGSGL